MSEEDNKEGNSGRKGSSFQEGRDGASDREELMERSWRRQREMNEAARERYEAEREKKTEENII